MPNASDCLVYALAAVLGSIALAVFVVAMIMLIDWFKDRL